MALDNILKARLGPLAYSLGGMDAVELLPIDTLIAATAHGEEIIGIHDYGYKFILNNIIGDYEVFDKKLESKYTATPIDSTWGENDIDLIYMVQLAFGEYFYIAFTDNTHDRLIMVIRA